MDERRLSLVGLAVMAAGAFGLLAHHRLLATTPPLVALQLLALALLLWARVTFGRRSFHVAADPTAGDLVTSGPYRFVRHPIYAAAILLVGAGAACRPTPLAILFAALVAAGAAIRIVSEERLLLLRRPDYRAYAARTARIVPFLY